MHVRKCFVQIFVLYFAISKQILRRQTYVTTLDARIESFVKKMQILTWYFGNLFTNLTCTDCTLHQKPKP